MNAQTATDVTPERVELGGSEERPSPTRFIPPPQAWGPLICVGVIAPYALYRVIDGIWGRSLWDLFAAPLVVTALAVVGVLLLVANSTPTPAQWATAKRAEFKASPHGIPASWKTGRRRHIAVHEAGHHGVAAAQGKKARSYIYDHNEGGFCAINSWWRNPVDNIAFLLGGQLAVGDQHGCSADNAMIRGFLKQVPEGQRSEAMATAQRQARSGLSKSSGFRSLVERVLFETGRFE